ncbi:MAG: DHHA1 domain-containing protein, partial [Saprospiraceae bacterium]
YLRFDFSHHSGMTDEEVHQVEKIVNERIRQNIALDEKRNIPLAEAQAAGATMLFGEKYGETVRMITFDSSYSIELCGGIHVPFTGEIGYFKIRTETSVASGIRRIEALTAIKAEEYLDKEIATLNEVRGMFKNAKDLPGQVSKLQDENKNLQKEIEKLLAAQASGLKDGLKSKFEDINGVNLLTAKLPLTDSNAIKTMGYELEKEMGTCLIVFGAIVKNKPQLMVIVSKDLVETKGLHAGNMIRELAKNIKGGGGGQPFFATAGGKDASGIEKALEMVKGMIG